MKRVEAWVGLKLCLHCGIRYFVFIKLFAVNFLHLVCNSHLVNRLSSTVCSPCFTIQNADLINLCPLRAAASSKFPQQDEQGANTATHGLYCPNKSAFQVSERKAELFFKQSLIAHAFGTCLFSLNAEFCKK